MSTSKRSASHGPSPLAVLKLVVARIPLVWSTIFYHALGVTQSSKYWSLTTELVITIIRSFIADDSKYSISFVQNLTTQDKEVKGNQWVSRVVIEAPPEDSARDVLLAAVESLRDDSHQNVDLASIAPTELCTITGEWNGYRQNATRQTPEPKISEREKYDEMMKEVSNPTTILYVHGGAYWLLDPATHRDITVQLAKLTKGRVLSIRYRLAPKHAFPTPLLDALVSYMTLLYPPPDAFHDPVKPEHIVLAGESAGGGIIFSLLQLILELQRQGKTIRWFGQEREVPLPAGVAGNSPWLDITSSSPSCEANAVYDYLLPNSLRPEGMDVPPCAIWPTTPTRAHIQVADEFLRHPLMSVFAAKDWSGSCPVMIETGEELLTDEGKYLASVMAKQGVPVVFEQYQAMPHCFGMILRQLPASKRVFKSWADFITKCVEEPKSIKTQGTYIHANTLQEDEVVVEKVSSMTEEDVQANMQRRVHEIEKFMMENPRMAAKRLGSKL